MPPYHQYPAFACVRPALPNPAPVLDGVTSMRRASGSRKPSLRGFSLVEVVIALGVIAFAFVPMVGMLPMGLDLSRQAIDTTVAAQIAQQLTTEAQQTDFSLLSELADASVANPYFFDDQGNKVANANSAIYAAVIALNASTKLPDNVDTTRLATVTVCILNTKASRTSQEPDLRKNRDARKIVALIPDNGR